MDKIDIFFKASFVVLVFLAGFFSSTLFNQNPAFTGNVIDARSPSNFVNDEDIWVYPDRVVIFIENASVSNYAPTGSMVPFLGSGSNGLRIRPSSAEDIGIGDIVSFTRGNKSIVHRVIDIGIDEEGTYFITRGDNSMTEDELIRFEDIDFVTIGIIY